MSVEGILSPRAEKFGRGTTLLCCVSENFWQRKFEKEGEGVLKVSVEKFLCHSSENFGRGTTLLCCVSENFWQRKRFEEREGVLNFPVESFLSHSAENFGRGTTLLCCVSENFWRRKFLKRGGRSFTKFCGNFCLTVPKNLVGEQPFCAVFQKISGSEKVLKKRGKEYQEFPGKILCLTVPKNLVGEQPYPSVLCFRDILTAKKF